MFEAALMLCFALIALAPLLPAPHPPGRKGRRRARHSGRGRLRLNPTRQRLNRRTNRLLAARPAKRYSCALQQTNAGAKTEPVHARM